MDHTEKQQRKKNPREKSGILSVLFFTYAAPIFRKGLRRDLQDEDLYEVVDSCSSKDNADLLEMHWEKERKKHPKSPSVYKTVWNCYGKMFLTLSGFNLICKIVNDTLEPLAIRKIISYFEKPNKEKSNQTAISFETVILYMTVLIGLKMLFAMYMSNFQIMIRQLGIRLKAATCSLIYRKSLKLSPTNSNVNVGNIITVITKDVGTFEHTIMLINDVVLALFEIALFCTLLYWEIGLPSLAGILGLFIVTPLQIFFTKCVGKVRGAINKKTDERLQVTQETLSAIKVIKMYVWELFFERKIAHTRKTEMKLVMKGYFYRLGLVIVSAVGAKLSFYLMIVTYIWMGENVTAQSFFYMDSVFRKLRHTVGIMIPFAMGHFAELYVSANRIKKVLLAEELPQTFNPNIKTYKSDKKDPKASIELEKLCIRIKDRPVLDNISLKLKEGLTVVSGPLGCGKSSLLKAFLKDYPPNEGQVIVNGTISYASQEPWLFPSSIRQNILFGLEYDPIRYQEVVEVCELVYDFRLLEKGDQTIVADRGLNLSGGQQARINLARAIYRDSDIYLLDDSLSALDSQVQDTIFKKCIKEFLKNKLVVLVTHNAKHIAEADYIVILYSHGKLKVAKPQNAVPLDEVIESIDLPPVSPIAEKTIEELEMADETTKMLSRGEKGSKAKNVYKEVKREGKVDIGVYKKYIKFGGGYLMVLLVAILFIISQGSESYSDKLISKWLNLQHNITEYELNQTRSNSSGILNGNYSSINITSPNPISDLILNFTASPINKTDGNHTFVSLNQTETNVNNFTNYLKMVYNRDYTLKMFGVMLLISTMMEFVKIYVAFNFCRKASVNLHKSMVSHLLNCVLIFYDTYFIGNILNRFSQDLSAIDEHLPMQLTYIFRAGLGVLGAIILVLTVNWFFIIPSVILVLCLVCLRETYLPTSRSLKRLEAATKSPMIGHLNASLEGMTTIKACKAENILKAEFDRHQDLYTSAHYTYFCMNKAFSFFIDFFSVIYVTAILVKLIFFRDNSEAGDVGLAINQSMQLCHIIRWAIGLWAEIENQMTSVERVLEYTDIKQESKSGQTIDNWPEEGQIVYNNVSLSYNGVDQVLNNVSLTINPQEKIGIIGRTGAGKSSIISTLFRLYDFIGNIFIDNVDTKLLDLNFLREHIAIIPQEPTLFAGTIRSNLDPMTKYTDTELWDALDRVEIKDLVHSLDMNIKNNDRTFSTGQKQLICLARAIVRKNKIVVLDEATANMDPETDKLILNTIKQNFKNCTVLTIAHRLHSILDSDKVLVLEKGMVCEYDNPQNLLNNPNSEFYKIAHSSGLKKHDWTANGTEEKKIV